MKSLKQLSFFQRLIPLCLVLFLSSGAFCEDSPYKASLIPESLKAHADAVVRAEVWRTEVNSIDNVMYDHKCVITILDKKGLEDGQIVVGYSTASENIKSIRGAIYNMDGKLIKKLHDSDFHDVSADDGFSLFSDERERYYIPNELEFPFTIEYEIESKSNSTFYFPSWLPQAGTAISVEKSEYELSVPIGFQIRYKELNFSIEPKQHTENEKHYYHWETSNLAALRDEPYSPPSAEYVPYLYIAPIKFSYLGLPGEFKNWDEYGKWYYTNLIKGRDQISQKTLDEITELVKDISDDKEKAKKIYAYVQSRTRYVSVQIGIGGFQPAKASDVDRLKYGDCKGLVNYTMALLNAVGIKAYIAEVYAGNTKFDAYPDFATAGTFNHVIVCVPFKKDSTWLECTSQDNPFGHMSLFTDYRTAVLLKESGGELIYTSKYPISQNYQNRTVSLEIEADGSAKGNMSTRFSGLQYDNRNGIENKSVKDRDEALKNHYPVPELVVESYRLDRHKNRVPEAVEQMSFSSSSFGTAGSDKLFFPINVINHAGSVPREVRNRKNKVYIRLGYVDRDTLIFKLPQGYKAEFAPQEQSFKSDFGSYHLKSEIKGNQVICIRTLTINGGTYPAEKYDEWVEFKRSMYEADDTKLTLIKTGG